MAEAVGTERAYGGQTMVGQLRRVLVRRPPADTSGWRRFGWRSRPDAVALAGEHEQFCVLLEASGVEVVSAPPTTLDAIYTYDPALVADVGAVLLRPGKPERLEEVDAIAGELEQAGVPVAARLEDPALAEGGDTAWLDEHTLLAGRGYRTNSAGIHELERILGVETLAFDLPHFHGATEVMHLLSLFSPLDRDLVVAYPPLMPVGLVQLLADREIRIVEVPDEEFASMGPNALALAPRRALVLDRNPETRRRLEGAGVDVVVYRGEELSKGDGGPTCLTRPLLRVA
jgi:dimethylargininase